MEFEPNEIALWLTRLTVGGALAAGLLAVLSAAWPVVRDEWRKGRDRVAKAVFLAAAFAGVLYGGAKRATVTYPRTDAAAAYLVDRGSYVTNDYVRIDFERRIVPDDAALVIERRPVASTNDLEWAEYLRTTFAAFSVPTNLPCANATNWNWIVFADWTPPPSVHTNGILEVKWGTSRNDAAHRASGLAVGIPAQTTAWRDGEMLGTPGGTNGLANAAALTPETAGLAARDALDALTGAAPALGEAVQGEDPISHESSRIDTNPIREDSCQFVDEKKGTEE